MTRVVSIILPNPHKLWERGESLSVYSRSYDSYTNEQDFTELGKMVRDYKYSKWIKESRKAEIVKYCGDAIMEKLHLNEPETPGHFNCLMAIPPNVNSEISLPRAISAFIASKLESMSDCSSSIRKVKDLPSMKTITAIEERAEILKGAYEINRELMPKQMSGILIIDDVFQSGSTVREVARTLKREFPDVPRYVITITHLRGVWEQLR